MVSSDLVIRIRLGTLRVGYLEPVAMNGDATRPAGYDIHVVNMNHGDATQQWGIAVGLESLVHGQAKRRCTQFPSYFWNRSTYAPTQ
jgi:hypothetical protein